MTRILFEPGNFPPHMRTDLELLKKHFDVDVFKVDFADPAFIIKVPKKILEADLTYSRFACKKNLYLILLSRLLGKKSILLSGGYDVAKIPEIGYGSTLHPLERAVVKITLLLANRTLAFSESSKKSVLECMPKANVETVYVGAIDTDKFKPRGEKQHIVLTVGHVNWSNLKRKGLETFVKSAKYLPHARFTLVGRQQDDSITYLRSISTPNVNFAGYLNFETLLGYYQRSKVYVQASAHEGFGISIAEAMACKCIPVVTRKAAIPEVVGDAGFYVPYGDAEATAEAIKTALSAPSDFGAKARERVKDLFSVEKREKKLLELISQM